MVADNGSVHPDLSSSASPLREWPPLLPSLPLPEQVREFDEFHAAKRPARLRFADAPGGRHLAILDRLGPVGDDEVRAMTLRLRTAFPGHRTLVLRGTVDVVPYTLAAAADGPAPASEPADLGEHLDALGLAFVPADEAEDDPGEVDSDAELVDKLSAAAKSLGLLRVRLANALGIALTELGAPEEWDAALVARVAELAERMIPATSSDKPASRPHHRWWARPGS